MKKTLRQAIDELVKGIRLNSYEIRAHRITIGRFHEEQNVQINLRNQGHDVYLFRAKVFHGRPPTYAPWVELYDIEERINLSKERISYFDSQFEDMVLEHFTDSLEPGARIFVEYYSDHETKRQLEMEFPAVLSRLGHKMFQHGCTWFKDWYFPEGYMEGNQKLQGEKPLHAKARERHLKAIRDEVLNFVEKSKMQENPDEYTRRALARIDAIVSAL